ncbi:MAG TPA: SLBB domain-containing protein [Bacteroidota bacterium]|nr:SLBB domain-containing protein [Bacteroidota bacterium]
MNRQGRSSFVLAAVIALLSLYSPTASAQIGLGSLLSATSDRVTSTNYYFARPNDLTIIVNVVGFVQRPGRYEIASTIDLINLISLAGGPMPDGALNKVTITRIVKTGEQTTWKNIHVDLEDLRAVKSSDLLLEPGDVIAMDRTAWSAFRDGFSVVVSGAIIATAVSQVIIATRR